jgi:hypothetical protein
MAVHVVFLDEAALTIPNGLICCSNFSYAQPSMVQNTVNSFRLPDVSGDTIYESMDTANANRVKPINGPTL